MSNDLERLKIDNNLNNNSNYFKNISIQVGKKTKGEQLRSPFVLNIFLEKLLTRHVFVYCSRNFTDKF